MTLVATALKELDSIPEGKRGMRTPSTSLPDALVECLEAAAVHPRMLEACLDKYRHYRQQLEPLLKVVSVIQWAVHEVQAPPPYLYVVPGGRGGPLRGGASAPLVQWMWDRVDVGLRSMARRHTLAMLSALLSLFVLLALSGWALVMGSLVLVTTFVPPFEPLCLVLGLGVLLWVFLAMAIRSADRWLLLLAYSAPAPGLKVPLPWRRHRALGIVQDLWNSPNLGMRLAWRLSVWTLVRVAGLALVIGWLLPVATAGFSR